ncbi:MAG: glycosyltransferase family 4 protein [Sphingopyxis sp.]|uniref:glycosyltransferase family 4 protein n=1 Tax=Sphingopyxis sp. TaxID=1908224 RepID=UPI001A4B025B|nr:glycosyltransferase family 4 protein [Sphingopyxis sp.]MBL9067142.1 glycosyltransferase family 4 protein [Sphingopyxis sp.]
MKIGYLVPEFPGQTHGFFWREILHVEAAGDDVTIFSTRRPSDHTTHEFSEIAKARTLYLTDLRFRDAMSWLGAAIAALALLARDDVRSLRRHGESWFKIFGLGVVGARLAAICRRENLKHIHGHSCADAGYVLAFSKLSGGPPFSLSLHGDLAVYGHGHHFKFGHAKFVACVTDALRKQVQTHLPDIAHAPQLIRMGIERNPAAKKRGYWSPPRTLRIVTVARLNHMKGHQHAIAAVAALKQRGVQIRYDIIGEGDYHSEIAAQIKSLGLQPEVNLVGPLANDQIVEQLSLYDAFVLPSVGLGEAAPVAVMEAMGAGVPVVCSIIGGTPEMIEHGQTGFLFPQCDEAALIEILAHLADDPDARKRVGSAGQNHAHSSFLTSVSATKLMHCIRQ